MYVKQKPWLTHDLREVVLHPLVPAPQRQLVHALAPQVGGLSGSWGYVEARWADGTASQVQWASKRHTQPQQ